MSQAAINYRKTLDVPNHRGNIAVIEYVDNSGAIVKKPFTTVPNVTTHTEFMVKEFFLQENIPFSQLKRLFSELRPCGTKHSNCSNMLKTDFPDAKVTFSFNYGNDSKINIISLDQRELELTNFLN